MITAKKTFCIALALALLLGLMVFPGVWAAEHKGAPPRVLVEGDLEKGYQYLPYSQQNVTSEGSWLHIVSGRLPNGLRIATDDETPHRALGEIWGAPLESGNFVLKARAVDKYGISDGKEVVIKLRIEPAQTDVWIAKVGENDDHILKHLGVYDQDKHGYVVEILMDGAGVSVEPLVVKAEPATVQKIAVKPLYATSGPKLENMARPLCATSEPRRENMAKISYTVRGFAPNPAHVKAEDGTVEDEDTEYGDTIYDFDFSDFVDLWIDGIQIKVDEGYIVDSGSTIITLFAQILAYLDPKINHVIAGDFKSGGTASNSQTTVAQTFTIVVVKK